MQKKSNGAVKFPKKRTLILVPIAAVLLVVAIVANIMINLYWEIIAAAFSDTESATNQNLMDEAVEESRALNAEILEEGSVLLKNDDVLPMPSSVSKVNVYGVMSGNMYLNTKGSGSVNNSNSVSLKTALANSNIEVNSSLWNLIEKSSSGTSSGGANDINEGSIKDDKVTEISLTSYANAASWSAAKTYSDYAIVTFGRGGAEGSDLGRTYLTLGDGEVSLLQKLHSEGFKVITLINSSHVMELGPVEQYSDAILWIGGPGLTGLNGVARVLTGEVSPSGRLVDTWMYDETTSSTYYTAQQYNYTYNGSSIGGFTNYNEGIYVGYKWYETADAEGYWNNVNNSYGTGYQGVVTYPFGYGLSYGELSEEITSFTQENGVLTFTVKATNANSVPSKDVFELYVEKPYTNGGTEVSKVELVGFAKSEAIKDGNSYTTTITVSEDDLASYDSTYNNGKGAYVLAGGEYKFYLASGESGSHCWATYADDENRTCTVTLSQKVGRSSDVVAAENQLGATSGTNGNALAVDDNNAGFIALSRKDGFANATVAIGKNSCKNIALTQNSTMYKLLTEYTDFGTYQGEIAENLKTEQSKKYSFADLYTTDSNGNMLYTAEYDDETGDLISKVVTGEVDFDDPRWEYLISQMSVSEMEALIGFGGWRTAKVASIDKALGLDYDGPSGLSNLMKNSIGEETKCTSFCSEPVTASTWNVELVERLGEAVGKEANESGQSGWYAPGANIHRSPFGGRNAEYFSEDAYISGIMCAVESKGALNLGLYCVAKHFAFNDIEANRTSLENCWMSEQTAREIYLKAFEIGCKSGDVPALMASYMWINGEWLGGDYSLLTNIVRNEWGYNGMITTDNAGQGGGYKWMSPSKMIYAGGDMVLANPAMKLDSSIKTSEEGISAMKTATKHILYTVASAYLNRLEATRVGENTFIPIYIVINIVLFGGMAGCLIAEGVSLALYFGKRKKITQSETQGTSETQGMPETQGTSETQGMQETQGTSETQQQTNDL